MIPKLHNIYWTSFDRLWNVTASVFVFVVLISTTALSETHVEDAIKLSQLTLSAMECANYTDDNKEFNRLFDLSIDSGKKFIQTWNNMSEEERKTASPNIAVVWRAVQGFSVDFVLGQVWNEMSKDAYRRLGDDTKQWQYQRPQEYRNRNCSILR
jgi:hypothetical protein